MIGAANESQAAVPSRGLTSKEAARRLATEGANVLPGSGPRTLLTIVRSVLAEPMLLLLAAAVSLYVILGDVREALVLSASLLIVVAITVIQERRTEHALARLRDLSSPRALVIRDDAELRIAGRDVVRGDLLLLREGDRVPADAVVRSATALSLDESIITGESLPVDKPAASDVNNRDAAHLVFSGSLIVGGYGTAEVLATGTRSQIGRIGHALATLQPEITPLFREVRRIVRWVAIAALLLCAAVAGIYGATRSDWIGGALAGITLAMGVLPEEFPVVLTLFLAMGAWRISRHGVLIRRMPAIESIGAVTVLAVDKTGTLTENRMRVALLEAADQTADLRVAEAELNDVTREILVTALAASERDPFDPMERAIHEAAGRLAAAGTRALAQMELVREYDLTPQLLAVTHVWQDSTDTVLQVAVKGAPETVFQLCRLPTSQRTALLERVAIHAADGLRVLAVARGVTRRDRLPDSPHSFDLQLLGVLCLADPLRVEVPESLEQCAQAGIRVIMITGDHPGTALAIARQAGFDTQAGVLTGAEVAALDDESLRRRVADARIYARTTPDQKLRLVQALKANGEVVAMTGDGVNDAPALKAAHVGVAMGGRGTDVAREAASIVLVKDDFGSLVRAVRDGRRIYDNLRHAMSFIVAVHIPIAGIGLLPVLAGWPLVLFPLHVLFLEFIIDPACSFVFESDPEAGDIMQRRPRAPTAPLFSRTLLIRSIALGMVMLIFVAAIYVIGLAMVTQDQARALAFSAFIVVNLTLIFVSRAPGERLAPLLRQPNPIFWWIATLSVGLLACVLYIPPIAAAFRVAAPSIGALAGVAIAGCACVLVAGLGARRWHGAE